MAWRPSWWLDLLKIIWPVAHLGARATRIPVAREVIASLARPLFNEQDFNITYLPINANLQPAASMVLSREILTELICRSAHRVIVRRCSCRDSLGCQTYPVEDACLLLGFDTVNIRPEIARPVSVAEALAHVEARTALGLTPMTGRVRVDDLLYGASNRKRMLTICFCCPCCCTVLNSVKYIPAEFKSSIVKLQGTRVQVDLEKCCHCGICAAACLVEAIVLQNGSIHHDHEKCIGCGRCSTACPQGATSLVIEDPQAAISEILGRMRERVNIE
ncbi:MAG: 4Fe-4S binding protein [Anaerolineales bacterium]|nr:4Fe-4S binding protein [Anaerolineales bacterium]